GRAGTLPREPDQRSASVLVILQLELVILPALQGDRAGVFRDAVVRPVVDEELAVDPEPHAVVGLRDEGDGFGGGGLGDARPTDRERVRTDAGHGASSGPVEVDGAVVALDLRPREVHIVEVLSPQVGRTAAASSAARPGGPEDGVG